MIYSLVYQAKRGKEAYCYGYTIITEEVPSGAHSLRSMNIQINCTRIQNSNFLTPATTFLDLLRLQEEIN
jgi:hypothetical protein